ncbi:uncharacterized protein C8Q71DRAFT_717129 [Rhodofomes roseus]|uniref:CCHC-type domain-containing protein n=1 Tax=Rhodofomes roseus TaxID=34475 RepID=A0ABQ8K232_9APHY|nr:uncharacterized protein C8Q71DRAFT_717129 [Rhodofomes roseus]KAH9830354.1 hypothetical protein C8Q71DRAFT_717129 [Rhodofomes roseus]
MQWISRVQKAAMELHHTPVPVATVDIVLVISDGLPNTYDPVITALDGLDYSQLTLPLVISRVIGHESKLARSKEKERETLESPGSDPSSYALVARHGNKKAGTSPSIICYNCGGRGHIKVDCPSPSVDVHAHVAALSEKDDGDEHAMLATMETIRLF